MKKTKIICTIGPATAEPDVMEKLVNYGMNIARINFSHATIEEREMVVASVKEARKRTNQVIGILYDTKGPEFRTGMLKDGSVELIDGNNIIITKENILGTAEKITVNYHEVLDAIEVGSIILIEDGLLKLEVIKNEQGELLCKIINGGILSNRKNVNVPGVKLPIPFLSEQDKEDIKYAAHHEGDFIALSFVETKEDILAVREILAQENSNMLIVSKVESSIALANIDDIIEYSDGIMVARGDLGVEVPIYEVPFLQKKIIKKCRQNNKFCIVATEMLASMTKSSRPTRAEATDVTTAVLDGTDVVMLSGETSIGKYPVMAVKSMTDIVCNAEKHSEYNKEFIASKGVLITGAVAKSVVEGAHYVNAKLIVVPTNGGTSVRTISNLRPSCPILALCKDEATVRKLAINYGVYAVISDNLESFDNIVQSAKEKAREFMDFNSRDTIIIAGGFSKNHNTKIDHFMKIEEM